MPTKSYPNNVLEQTRSVLSAWKQLDEFTISDLTPAALEEDLNQIEPLLTEITALEAKLTDARNKRDTLNLVMWEKVKRVRAGVKANFGDDSSQYEMVGGTRLSERKPSIRKAKTKA
jgi:Cdc6-like AAA superfamily ATPase